MTKVNLTEKLSLFTEHWSPKVVAELNGQQLRLVKFAGEFVWHSHAEEDELFLVLEGEFVMQFRDPDDAVREVPLKKGEFLVVPRGTQHRPVAEREVSVLLFEPAQTRNTGDARDSRTVDRPPTI